MNTRLFAIGATGFEPATSRPPAERATKLRHTPTRYDDLFSTDFVIIADIFRFEKRFTAGFLFVIILLGFLSGKRAGLWEKVCNHSVGWNTDCAKCHREDVGRSFFVTGWGQKTAEIVGRRDRNMGSDVRKGIVSFDMDMTLLDHADWKIPDSAREALKSLKERYYVVIATGRDMDARYSAGLTKLVDPDAVIHLNGTKITVGDDQIYEHRMDSGLVKRLLSFTEGKNFAMGVSVGTEDYYMNPEWVTRHDMIRWGQSDRCFRDPWRLLEMPVRTMAYIGREPGSKLVEEAFCEVKLPMFSSGEGADVIEKSASKAEGLRRLCEYWKVPLSQTIAFGDSMNDYEIIRMAGTGVAMGNAREELKQAADYVTAPIGEDGVWKACVHLGLLEGVLMQG